MLSVTYNNKIYNVLVEEVNRIDPSHAASTTLSRGGTHRKQSTQRNKCKQNRSKPTRRIKR